MKGIYGSLALAGFVALVAAPAEGRQVSFDRARVEAGAQVVGLASSDGSLVAYGPRVSFNLNRLTAVDVTVDFSDGSSGFSNATTRVLLLDLRRVLFESPNGALFATIGAGGGQQHHSYTYYNDITKRTQSFEYQYGIGVATIGVGARRALGPHVALVGELQYSLGPRYTGLRATFGVTMPLGSVARRPDSRAPRPLAFSSVPVGQTAWVTDADGIEYTGEVLAVTTTEIQLRSLNGIKTVPLSEVRLIKAPDSIKDGAKKGAIAGGITGSVVGLLGGIGLCEQDGGCAVGVTLVSAGISTGLGALIGAFVDSLHEGTRVVFDAAHTKATIGVAPILKGKAIGLGGTVRW